MTSAHVRRLRQISISTPEEYALLSILLGLEPDALFEGQEIPIALRDRMQALADAGRLFTKQGVASELGIRTEQVMPYAKRFGINPFWVQSGKRKTETERQGVYGNDPSVAGGEAYAGLLYGGAKHTGIQPCTAVLHE